MQKQVRSVAERLSAFSTTAIPSTVGQRELHAHIETFQTCMCIATETIKLSSLRFPLSQHELS